MGGVLTEINRRKRKMGGSGNALSPLACVSPTASPLSPNIQQLSLQTSFCNFALRKMLAVVSSSSLCPAGRLVTVGEKTGGAEVNQELCSAPSAALQGEEPTAALHPQGPRLVGPAVPVSRGSQTAARPPVLLLCVQCRMLTVTQCTANL